MALPPLLLFLGLATLRTRCSASSASNSSGRLRGARIRFGGGLRPLRLPARDFSGSGG